MNKKALKIALAVALSGSVFSVPTAYANTATASFDWSGFTQVFTQGSGFISFLEQRVFSLVQLPAVGTSDTDVNSINLSLPGLDAQAGISSDLQTSSATANFSESEGYKVFARADTFYREIITLNPYSLINISAPFNLAASADLYGSSLSSVYYQASLDNSAVTYIISSYTSIGGMLGESGTYHNILKLALLNNSNIAVSYTVDWNTTASAETSLFSAPVPEPETYGMMLMGFCLMSFVARRRKNNQA